MSVLMRRENTLIIEPGSDISKIQIINFILLPNSKKHFEGPPLYKIIENGAVKCEITKKLFSFGDQFQIEVTDEGEAPLVIAAVLAIQSVLQKRSLELALD
ncbi:Hypothetical_protein [Hexamita inflata]|uniref:Hypothetical_protein n=1 Tax=Hexamita inflata TaxID=28002 RepID=A0AA86P644_9EUKA|nr:Hypothetical protein HINF_LOCUS20136 [Hexamita inflata]